MVCGLLLANEHSVLAVPVLSGETGLQNQPTAEALSAGNIFLGCGGTISLTKTKRAVRQSYELSPGQQRRVNVASYDYRFENNNRESDIYLIK
jgi:hypothetical protein